MSTFASINSQAYQVLESYMSLPNYCGYMLMPTYAYCDYWWPVRDGQEDTIRLSYRKTTTEDHGLSLLDLVFSAVH